MLDYDWVDGNKVYNLDFRVKITNETEVYFLRTQNNVTTAVQFLFFWTSSRELQVLIPIDTSWDFYLKKQG